MKSSSKHRITYFNRPWYTKVGQVSEMPQDIQGDAVLQTLVPKHMAKEGRK